MPLPEIPRWTAHPSSGRAYDPFAHADELGLQVLFRPLTEVNELWLPDFHTIVVKETMTAMHQRSACAHGVAHALLGHEDDRPKFEVAADRLASHNLIDHDELIDLMRWTPDPARLAYELGVTGRMLRVYLNVNRLAG